MKNLFSNHKNCLYIIVLLCIISTSGIFAQVKSHDSTYLPPIKILSANGYGPYVIGTKRTNVFIAYELPKHTSKIVFRFIDSKGIQVGKSYTKQGSNLSEAMWNVESDTMDLPLSPQLSVEVHYQTDSVAVYNIAYTVYPDTIKFSATEGCGPFITNNYPFTDTSWQPVPPLYNTFTVKNLPPRTDSLAFLIIVSDSIVIDSLFVSAPVGSYLDSAIFPNVRMDMLPLNTQSMRTLIWCEGGPGKGLEVHKELTVVPQKPKLISKSEGVILFDSIGIFVQNQLTGQALLIDSVKHATIQNGPGTYFSPHSQAMQHPYKGPYSLDLMKKSYSIEAWLRFDIEKMNPTGEGMIMSVDSVWEFYVLSGYNKVKFYLVSLAGGYYHELFTTAYIDFEEFQGSEWHHIAFTSLGEYRNYPIGHFYLDGKQLSGTTFHQDNYDYIMLNIDYPLNWKTKPLFLGSYPVPERGTTRDDSNYILTAMDEIRIWNRALSAEEIKMNFRKTILQDASMLGYWNFNDLRNRLGIISDISYNNNNGKLQKGASFIPQYPYLQKTMDTIEVISSNALTDSIIFQFIDDDNKRIDSDTLKTCNAGDTILYDVSALPYNISHLRICEYFPGAADSGFLTDYNLEVWAPKPIATPQYNWNTYFANPYNSGKLYAPIIVSGLPVNTTKVSLGLTNGEEIFDTISYTENSIPFRNALTLNGSDNYIETSQCINSPDNFTMMFWVKTTSKTGGKLIGFTDTQNGITNTGHDREIVMQPDGSLRFHVRMGGTLHTLYGVNVNNDGGWHHVAAVVDNAVETRLFVDGCLVDLAAGLSIDNYQGYWVIGRNNESTKKGAASISEYFTGTLTEISIWNHAMDYDEVNANMFLSANNADQVLHYKLNEGTGTVIHDSQGNNHGELMGSSQRWQLSNAISFVAWNKDMVQKNPGTYTFFARVFYPDSPESGAYYPLGNFNLQGFVDGSELRLNLTEGQGYFNEGTALNNTLKYWTDYTNMNMPFWKMDFIECTFLSPDHDIICNIFHGYEIIPFSNQFVLDMGDAPQGSYLSLKFGYMDTGMNENVTHTISIPVYIRPMIPPKVSGDFGPFNQAIAPGVMQHDNTFIITTEVYSDLNKVTGRFYDISGKEIAHTEAVPINDTLWHLTYNMAAFSPPETSMRIEYYLGTNPHPVLIEGPFTISIFKTRPKWFDFIPDTSFHDISQSGNSVTFSVSTPLVVESLGGVDPFNIPSGVPILGGTGWKMEAPTTMAYLKICDFRI